MAVFFFMVGLDVRRDFTLGDLRLPGHALLPAVGGFVAPAAVFWLVAGAGTAPTRRALSSSPTRPSPWACSR